MRLVATSLLLASAISLPANGTAQSTGRNAIDRTLAPKPEPHNTRGLPEELRPIDYSLRGGLISDPTNLNWDYYGLGRELVVDESYPGGGAALRIFMGDSGPVYAGGLSIPLIGKIKKGEQVTIGFFARTIDAPANDGIGKVRVRFQQDREPYPGFGETMLEIGKDAKWHEAIAVADQDIKSKGIVALQFGTLRQTVEVGQAIIVTGTSAVFD